jgi:hypothetical protein
LPCSAIANPSLPPPQLGYGTASLVLRELHFHNHQSLLHYNNSQRLASIKTAILYRDSI